MANALAGAVYIWTAAEYSAAGSSGVGLQPRESAKSLTRDPVLCPTMPGCVRVYVGRTKISNCLIVVVFSRPCLLQALMASSLAPCSQRCELGVRSLRRK